MYKTITSVSIKATTWNKEAQGLFDYDSSNTFGKNFEISSSARVYRVNDEIVVDEDNFEGKELPIDAQNVLYLKENEGSFSVKRCPQNLEKPTSKPENLWQVVKSVNPSITSYRGHVLIEGDVIKLGKIKLRVRELKPLNGVVPSESSQEANLQKETVHNCSTERELPSFIKRHTIEKLPEGQESSCRVCLESDHDEINPLITPCSCTGSVKYIHLGCLKTWIESKCSTINDESCAMYMWRNLECEICHYSLPDIFLYEDKEIHLLNLIKPETSYLILETLPEGKDIKKVFYVISVTKDNKHKILKLGRKADCEIKVNDISVSRLHAMIRLMDGKFYLENGFSKFGTLLLLQDETKLKKEHNLRLQVGRTVLSFELQQKEVFVPIEEPEEKLIEKAASDCCSLEEIKESEDKLFGNYLLKDRQESIRRFSNDYTQEIQIESLDHIKNPNMADESTANQDKISVSQPEPLPYYSGQVQEDLKHLDQLLVMMKEILGDRYKNVSESETSARKETSVSEETSPIEKEEIAQQINLESLSEQRPN